MAVVVKDLVWPEIGYKPHPAQVEVHNSSARHRVIAAGRRLGKSTIGGDELVPEAVLTHSLLPILEEVEKNRLFWIVGPDYTDVEKEFRVCYNSLKKIGMPFDKPGTYNNPLAGDMHISLWGGRFQIHGKSARYHESLDGEGLAGALLVEAAKLKGFIFGRYIRPALADEGGWSFHSSTPVGKNDFYKLWQRGQDPKYKDWASWRKPSWENPVLFPGGRSDPEILAMEQDMSSERFAQEIGAEFTDFVGRVFKDFDEEIHVADLEYRPDWPLVAACDFGWTNPFVWLAIQYDIFDNVYVLGEYRVTRRDINDIAKDLSDWSLARGASTLFFDPEDPGSAAVLEKFLHLKADGSGGGRRNWRLELIRKHLKYTEESEGHPDILRKPKLFIDRSCIGNPLGDGGLIREMQDYRYPDTKEESLKSQPEDPLDKDNHGPEALGRFFRGHFGGPAEEDKREHAVVHQAVMR